jgi:hypothetical protein
MRKILACLVLAASFGSIAAMRVPNPLGLTADELAVRRAALDYVEGIYEQDGARIKRSLHPRVRWSGDEAQLGYRDLVNVATNKCLAYAAASDAPRRVRVSRLRREAAIVNVAAAWGEDRVELKKNDGRWRIVRIQSDGLARHLADAQGRDNS